MTGAGATYLVLLCEFLGLYTLQHTLHRLKHLYEGFQPLVHVGKPVEQFHGETEKRRLRLLVIRLGLQEFG